MTTHTMHKHDQRAQLVARLEAGMESLGELRAQSWSQCPIQKRAGEVGLVEVAYALRALMEDLERFNERCALAGSPTIEGELMREAGQWLEVNT